MPYAPHDHSRLCPSPFGKPLGPFEIVSGKISGQSDGAVGLIEIFDFARCPCCGRAVLIMCLEQCWATPSSAANAGELRSREPPANYHDSFTLSFPDVGQISRSDGPRSEKGGPRTASSTGCCAGGAGR